MTDKDIDGKAALDDFFAASKSQISTPSDDLMARIMADAEAQIALAPVAEVPVKSGWARSLLTAMGGWQAATGLVSATVVGVVIGIAWPDSLDDIASGAFFAQSDYQLEDLLPSYGGLLEEG